MPTRAGREIVIKYVLFDLNHPEIQQARDDILSVVRKVGDRLELGVNRNLDNTRAVVKAVYALEDAAQVADWFQNRPWKDAVLAITDWADRAQVRAFVTRVVWAGETEDGKL